MPGAEAIRTLGAAPQAELALLSQALAAQARQTSGEALAPALAGVAAAVRDLEEAGRDLGRRHRWWDRLRGHATPASAYLQVLDRAAVEVDRLAEALRQEDEELAARLRSLRALQDRAERLARSLEEQAGAAEERLTGQNGEAGADRAHPDALDRRLGDLRLTRALLAETALSIRLSIEADELLSHRLTTLLCGVLPAWERATAPLIATARAAPAPMPASAAHERLRLATDQLLTALQDDALLTRPGRGAPDQADPG